MPRISSTVSVTTFGLGSAGGQCPSTQSGPRSVRVTAGEIPPVSAPERADRNPKQVFRNRPGGSDPRGGRVHPKAESLHARCELIAAFPAASPSPFASLKHLSQTPSISRAKFQGAIFRLGLLDLIPRGPFPQPRKAGVLPIKVGRSIVEAGLGLRASGSRDAVAGGDGDTGTG